MFQRLAPHLPPLSGTEAAGQAALGLFGVQAIKCARIPATRQGARERRWKRHGSSLLICLSIKGALGRRGSAGRCRRGPARPFRAPGQRMSGSPFALGTEGRAGGSSRPGRRLGGCKFSRCRSLVPRVALDPGGCHQPWGRLGPAQPGPAPRSAQDARPSLAPPGQKQTL